jgi:hypothetical protein
MDNHRFDEFSRMSSAASHPIARGRFPILEFIDQSLSDGQSAFAASANAAQLEQSAQVLTVRYWSDSVWITGLVSAAAFRSVCDALERERSRPTERPLSVTAARSHSEQSI